MPNPSFVLRSAPSGPVLTGTPGYVLTVDAGGRTSLATGAFLRCQRFAAGAFAPAGTLLP